MRQKGSKAALRRRSQDNVGEKTRFFGRKVAHIENNSYFCLLILCKVRTNFCPKIEEMLTEEEKNAGLIGRIVPVNIEEQMKSAYIDYSMSVIVSRAARRQRRPETRPPSYPLRYERRTEPLLRQTHP